MAESAIQDYRVATEPYYMPVGREVELFEAAHSAKLPVILKGPTGCGKTRFVEHMAWRLERPLITVACHEDLSATDLVGRFLLEGEETVWHRSEEHTSELQSPCNLVCRLLLEKKKIHR